MKREKIIRYDECFQCPHCFKDLSKDMWCNNFEKKISNAYKIPSWCKLENAPLITTMPGDKND